MADTRILLIGSADNDQLTRVLGGQGRALARVRDPEKLAAAGIDHDVIVIDSVPPPRTIADMCRELRAVAGLAEVPVLAISTSDDVEERIRLLEAGADDVMIRPIDERELDARVQALDLRHRRSVELRPSTVVTATRRPGKRLIAVYSPKGGVGTTTVSVNLALAIAAREPDRVALVDLTAMGGHVATQLDLRPKLTIAELLRDSQGTIGPEIMRATYLANHERGLARIPAAAG